jgi:two-component system, NtrC family, sensor kinase
MPESPYKKLGFRIALTIIIFCVIPLLLLGAVLYNHFSNQYQQKMMENFRTLAENRRGAINLFFDERISQLVTLANTSTLEEVKDEAYVRKAFEVMEKRSKTFLDLGVISQDGYHLNYVGPYGKLLKEVNYKNEDWFHSVMHTGEYVSDIFLGFRKIPHFIIAVLVRDKHED